MELELDLSDVMNLDGFSGVVPVFPLSSVVLFPGVLLPLHIFEMRYREMLRDVLNGEKIIAMALLKPGWENNYYEKPDIFNIGCMGLIVSTDYLHDGRANIALYGLKRIRLHENNCDLPYRVATAEIKEDTISNGIENCRLQLEQVIAKWNNLIGMEHKDHRLDIDAKMPLEKLTDSLATRIVSNIFERQNLLEELNVSSRAEYLTDYLQTRMRIFNYTSRLGDVIVKTRGLN